MSTNYTVTVPGWYQAMLDTLEDHYREEEGSQVEEFYYSSTAFLLTTAFEETFTSNAASYGFAFVGEFLSEIFDRTGNSDIAGYFGTDAGSSYALMPDLGDEWYEEGLEIAAQIAMDFVQASNPINTFLQGGGGITDSVTSIFQGLAGEEHEWQFLGFEGLGYFPLYQGTSGNDYFHEGSNDSFNAGNGDDYILDAYIARGENGNDYIEDSSQAWGGEGEDFLLSNNEAYGGNGDDYLINNSYAEGGDGNDYVVGTSGSDQLEGGNDDDYINGGSDADWIEGGAGNDVLNPGTDSDNDILSGGSGSDIATFVGDNDFTLRETFSGGNFWDKLESAWDFGGWMVEWVADWGLTTLFSGWSLGDYKDFFLDDVIDGYFLEGQGTDLILSDVESLTITGGDSNKGTPRKRLSSLGCF